MSAPVAENPTAIELAQARYRRLVTAFHARMGGDAPAEPAQIREARAQLDAVTMAAQLSPPPSRTRGL